MNRTQLLEFVTEKTGVKHQILDKILSAVFEGIVRGCTETGDCHFRGFGKFRLKVNKARKNVIPKIGEIELPERTTIKFNPSKYLLK